MFNEKLILKRIFLLYSRYGIKSIGVDDVAFMLGMSKKTIYEHFKNRDTLIEKAVCNNINSFLEELDAVINSEEDVFKKLCSFYVQIIKDVRKINPTFVHDLKKYSYNQYKIVVQLRDEKLYEMVSEIIKQGISEGLFRNDVPDKYLYFNQIDKVLILLNEFRREIPASPTSSVYKLILNDIRGMTTIKGHQRMNEIYDSLVRML
jgi:TetR/AcrR family transcriptional regulator, cholesterol catabolism regulator